MADPGGQSIKLFHPQLAVVIDRIKVAINDVANPALAGIDPDRGPVAQHRQHAVTTHGHAFCLVPLFGKWYCPGRILSAAPGCTDPCSR